MLFTLSHPTAVQISLLQSMERGGKPAPINALFDYRSDETTPKIFAMNNYAASRPKISLLRRMEIDYESRCKFLNLRMAQ